MRDLLRRRIDPTEPLYDGQALERDALAHLTASSKAAKAPVLNRAPIAVASTTRRHRPFRTDSRVGGTRFYQPKARYAEAFRTSATPPQLAPNRNLKFSSALLMAGSTLSRRRLSPRAEALFTIQSRAKAQNVINTLRHRWRRVNRVDLADRVANNYHLFKHARNTNPNGKLDPAVAAVLAYG